MDVNKLIFLFKSIAYKKVAKFGPFNGRTSKYDRLKNQRHAIDKYDKREKWRLYFFRILTTISIAAIVLLTYYIAACLGIPMPMMRLV